MMVDPAMNCSALDEGQLVGPVQMYESMGHYTTAVYSILVLHILPTWIIATFTLFRLPGSCCGELRPYLARLVCVPPTLMSLATAGILLPSSGPYIEVLLEIVLSFGMIQFIKLTTKYCRGVDNMVLNCASQKIHLPIGAPPFICLLALKSPNITRRNLNIVRVLPYLLLLAKVVLLAVDIYQRETGNLPLDYFSLSNLHNILSFPIGLVGIYSFTMYLAIVAQLAPDFSGKSIGIILLMEFVLFDSQRLFFIFLTGTGMLSCVPPSVPLLAVEHYLKNIIKGFLTMFVGIPYLKFCSDNIQLEQMERIGGSYASEFSSAATSDDGSTLQERPTRSNDGRGRRKERSMNPSM